MVSENMGEVFVGLGDASKVYRSVQTLYSAANANASKGKIPHIWHFWNIPKHIYKLCKNHWIMARYDFWFCKKIAWLSLNFILETSWVALYSDVCVWGIDNTWPNHYFFQYIKAHKPFADPVPPKTKQFQLIPTKYQPVSSYTDPVPSSSTFNSSSR